MEIIILIVFEFAGNGELVFVERFGDFANCPTHCSINLYHFPLRYAKMSVTQVPHAFFQHLHYTFKVQKCGSAYKFYPSRFVGYVNNNMTAHENNDSKDGRETNDAVSKIFGRKPSANGGLEKFCKDYCERLGFTANKAGSFGVKRKFWEVI